MKRPRFLFSGVPPLEEGEYRVIEVRSHVWQPVRVALPLPLLALSPIVFALLDILIPGLRLAIVAPAFLWGLALVIVIYFLKWFMFDLLPWTQRIYVLTNRRLIVQYGVFSVSRREISLLKVYESDYTSKGFLSRLFDIGDVEAHTAGNLDSIVLESVQHPRRLQGIISSQAHLRREEESSRRLAETPKEIIRQLASATGQTSKHNEPTQEIRTISRKTARAQQRVNLLPDEAVVEVIHQHGLILIIGMTGPFLAALLVALVVLIVGAALLPYAVIITVFVLAPWAIWRILTYLYHEFVLTTERLMELRSMPLLFDRRDIIHLASIQDILLEMPLFLGRILDIGDVVVEVAESSERVVLKAVPRPADIQKLIFETIDDGREAKRLSQDKRMAKMLAMWFEEYHKLQGSESEGKNKN